MAELFRVSLPKIDFHPELFENFIKERGMRVSWEQAALCPCVRADELTGVPKFNCGDCYNGNQYVNYTELTAAVTNVAGQRNATLFGDLALGGIYVTVPGSYRLGQNDRIMLLDQTVRYAELCTLPTAVVTANANAAATSIQVDKTRGFPTPVSGGFITASIGGQSIRYTGKDVTHLTGIPAAGPGSIGSTIAVATPVTLLEFKLRYVPKTVFDARTSDGPLVQGTDYEILENRIRFYPGRSPMKAFTVLYDAAPVYLVDSIPHEFRDQMLNLGENAGQLSRLPLSIVARKDFVNRVG